MRRSPISTLLTAGALVALSGRPTTSAQSAPPKVMVRVDWSRCRGAEPVLGVSVRSTDSRSLRVLPSGLPWGSRYSMLLVRARANSLGETLDVSAYIEDPVEETPLVVRPGGELRGEIDLLHRFPGLATALKSGDVLLFWSYRLPALGLAPSDRTGGWLLIPRDGQ